MFHVCLSGTAFVLNVSTRAVGVTLVAQERPITSVALSSNDVAAIASLDGLVRLFPSKTSTAAMAIVVNAAEGAAAHMVAFNASGSSVAVASDLCAVFVLASKDGSLVVRLKHDAPGKLTSAHVISEIMCHRLLFYFVVYTTK